MKESIEAMLSQLREQKEELDRLIAADVFASERWDRLCGAFDGLETAIYHLESI